MISQIIWNLNRDKTIQKVTKNTNKLFANSIASAEYGLLSDEILPSDLVYIIATRNGQSYTQRLKYGEITLEDGTIKNGWSVVSNGQELNFDLQSGTASINFSFNIKRLSKLEMTSYTTDFTTQTDTVTIYPSDRYVPQIETTDAEQIIKDVQDLEQKIGNIEIDIENKQDKTDSSLNTIDKTVAGAINENKGRIDTLEDDIDMAKSDIEQIENAGYITKDVNNLTNYTLSTKVGAKLGLSLDLSTYILTISLLNADGNVLDTKTVDLPLEEMIVNITYDEDTKEIVFTLKDGKETRIPVGDLINGLVTQDTAQTISGDKNFTGKLQHNGVDVATTHEAQKSIILGADGIEEEQAYSFTVKDSDSYLSYRTNGTKFLCDLHLPVVGDLTLNKKVAITFGDTTYYVYNILKGGEPISIEDLHQVDKYSNATGYRFITEMTFFQTSDLTGFYIVPTVNMSDILVLNNDKMNSYATNGGLTQGQIALCSNIGQISNYDVGSLYKFKIVYPNTYSWEKLNNVFIELNVPPTATQGTLTSDDLAILKATETNGIVFDHEYYKLSSNGHIAGYRTYFNIETENGDTSIKTITITENTLAWVLVDTDVEPKPVDETFTIATEMWTALNGNDPFKFLVSVTATHTIKDNTEVGILNNQPVLFANYGFVVGMVNNQNVILFAIDKPTQDVDLTIRFRR